MKNIARKGIMKIKPYVPGKPIEEVRRELGLREAVKLASNENALPPSPRVLGAARKALLTLNRYPDGGCFYLKRALAKYLGVNAYNLIVGNGSDEIIVLALRAFLKKNEEVIIAKPTFLVYEIASKIQGARIKFAPLKGLRYDVEGIAGLISPKTKLIFIANPDNPTGTYITKKETDFLVSRTPKDAILYFDEAYFEFAEDIKDYPKTLRLLSGRYGKRRNIIITRSFSKMFSLAGARIGYGISGKFIIDCMNRVREPFNVNSIAQAAALAALDDRNHVRKTLKLVERGRAFLYRAMDSLGVKYVPSVTNFILVNLGKDSKAVYGKLLKRGVIVREMSPWKLTNFIRVTIGTMRENVKFIQTLKSVL